MLPKDKDVIFEIIAPHCRHVDSSYLEYRSGYSQCKITEKGCCTRLCPVLHKIGSHFYQKKNYAQMMSKFYKEINKGKKHGSV